MAVRLFIQMPSYDALTAQIEEADSSQSFRALKLPQNGDFGNYDLGEVARPLTPAVAVKLRVSSLRMTDLVFD